MIPGMLLGALMDIVVWRIWCDNKVVINWMNGAWEVKGEEHTVPVRGVVDQLVRWYLGGTFWPRTDETDWCRHIFREHNKSSEYACQLVDGQW